MKKIHIKIESLSPYLMHRFAGTDEKSAKHTGTKNYKDEVETSVYRSPEGEIYVPSSQIHGCAIEAGKSLSKQIMSLLIDLGLVDPQNANKEDCENAVKGQTDLKLIEENYPEIISRLEVLKMGS